MILAAWNAMLYQIIPQSIPTPEFDEEMPDEQCMAAIVDRNPSALALLYRRHRLLLRSIIMRILNNEFEVDDLLQEIFVEIWNRSFHYDPTRGKALGWIVTLTRRRSIDRLRRKQAYHRVEERFRLELETSAEDRKYHRTAREVSLADRHQLLETVIKNLPEAQGEAIHFAFFSGMSQREISARTGVPLGTIKTRIDLALNKMRKGMLSMGTAEEWSS